jgi:hypothetical protein
MNYKQLQQRLEELLMNPDLSSVINEIEELSKEFYNALDNRRSATASEDNEDTIDADFDTIQEIKSLVKQYREKKEQLRKNRIAEEAKNLQLKQQILEDIRKLMSEEENISKAYQKFKEYREQWRNIGKVPSDKYYDLQREFSNLSDLFHHNMNIYKELREHDLKKNLQFKKELIEKLKKNLSELSDIRELEASLHVIQYQWEDTGAVPKESWEALKQEYWEVIRQIQEKVAVLRNERKKQQEEALAAKNQLIEKANNILNKPRNNQKDWESHTQELLALQTEWKAIGQAPREVNDKVWQDFRNVYDTFFDAKKAYYESLNAVFNENKKKKEEIIAQAESIKDSEDIQNTTNTLIKLQKEWQKIGSAGKKYEHILWTKFRAACDHFFNRKKAAQENTEKQYEENLQRKKDFIASIESKTFEGDTENVIKQLDELTREFNSIGHVPVKEKDAIYNAFKEAINKKYETLGINPEHKEVIIFKSKIAELQQADNASFLLNKERQLLRDKINKLTEEVKKIETNLGFFANAQSVSPMLQEYHQQIERNNKQIEILKRKLKLIPVLK